MIMFRSRDIVLVSLMLGLAAFTYKVKYEAQKSHAHIRQLERQIEAEHDTINLLKAEWALMSAPGRMVRLMKHYGEDLALDPVDPSQIVKLQDVPMRLPGVIDQLIAENEGEFSLDMLLTGSIEP